MEAHRLQLLGREVRAEGAVRLLSGGCMVEANSLRLAPGGALSARQARLMAGRALLMAHRLELRNGALTAEWVDGALCVCPGSPPLLSLSARRGWIAPGGRRLHLQWLALRVNSRALIKLPYWFLPLAPGVSGLLPPQIGWSARDGVRWQQGVYWAVSPRVDLQLAAGWIHRRGPQGQLTWRYFTEDHGDGELRLRGLADQGWWRGAISGALMVKAQGWSAGATPDLVSDGLQPIQLEQDHDRALATYLRSRLWARAGNETLALTVTGDMFNELQAPVRREPTLHGRLGAALGVMPVHLTGPLSLLGSLDVSHWTAGGALSTSLRGTQGDDHRMAVSQLRFNPAVALAQQLGPIWLSGRAAYFYGGTWAPQVRASGLSLSSVHGGALAMEATLPLERNLHGQRRRFLHRLEPLAAWSWSGSDTPHRLMPDGTVLWTGQRVMAGIRTHLMSRADRGPVRRWVQAQALLELPLAWPVADHSDLKPVLSGALMIGSPRWLLVESELRYLPTESRVAEVSFRGCARWGALRPCAGYQRARLDYLAEGLAGAQGPGWLMPEEMSILPLQLQLDQITAGLSWRWAPLSGDLQAAVDPAFARLTQISYAVSWTIGCGCYQLELRGRSWAGAENHNVMVGLRLLPGAAIGCEKANNL